jgi:hypothetical protein
MHPEIDPPEGVPTQVRDCPVCGRLTVWFEDYSKPPATFAGMSPLGHWEWTCTGRGLDDSDSDAGEPSPPAPRERTPAGE